MFNRKLFESRLSKARQCLSEARLPIFMEMLRGTPFKMLGEKAVMKLDDDKICQIHLSTNKRSGYGTVDHYTSIEAEVIDKKAGKLAHNTFIFDDYFKKRKDTRSDYKGGFYIWDDRGKADWYIARPDPSEIKNMLEEIVEWAEHFA